MNKYVNFKELRSKLRFSSVLELYGVQFKTKGEQLLSECPLPNHTGGKGDTFSANDTKGIFQCFGCKAKGNLLDFAGLMEKINLSSGPDVRRVAEKLQGHFFPEDAGGNSSQPPTPRHGDLSELGLSPVTIAHFGIEVAEDGQYAGSVQAPLLDSRGRTVGHAVYADDSEPPILLPVSANGFNPEGYLYHAWRFRDRPSHLIIVESFRDVWHLYDNGFVDVVCLPHGHVTEYQVNSLLALVKEDGRISILTGGDSNGDLLGDHLLKKLVENRFCKWTRLQNESYPTNLAKEELKEILG